MKKIILPIFLLAGAGSLHALDLGNTNHVFGTVYGTNFSGSAATATTASNFTGQVALGQLPSSVVTNNSPNVTLTSSVLASNANGHAQMFANGYLEVQRNDTNAGLTAVFGPFANGLSLWGDGGATLGSSTAGFNYNAGANTMTFDGTLTGSATSAGVVTGSQSNIIASALQNTSPLNAVNLFTPDNGGLNFYTGKSGNTNSSGSYNTSIGINALLYILTGDNNTALGQMAIGLMTNGTGNTAVGVDVMQQNLHGNNNTAVGNEAMINGTKGDNNVAVGYVALNQNSGSNNIAIGTSAGSALAGIESSNILIGSVGVLGDQNVTRIGSTQTNTYISGVISGNGSGLTNVPVTLGSAITGSNGAAAAWMLGMDAAGNVTSNAVPSGGASAPSANVVTNWAGLTNNPIWLGYNIGYSNALVVDGSFLAGANVGTQLTNCDSTVAIGNNSMEWLNNGQYAVAIGRHTLAASVDARSAVAVGHAAGEMATNAQSATFVGYLAGQNTYNAFEASMFGAYAGRYCSNAYYATFAGPSTCQNAVSAWQSFVGGFSAGINAGTITSSILIGQFSGEHSTGQNNILLGDHAGAAVTKSYQLVIDSNPSYSSNSATALISGDFTNRTLSINGALSINGSFAINGAPVTNTPPTILYAGSNVTITSSTNASGQIVYTVNSSPAAAAPSEHTVVGSVNAGLSANSTNYLGFNYNYSSAASQDVSRFAYAARQITLTNLYVWWSIAPNSATNIVVTNGVESGLQCITTGSSVVMSSNTVSSITINAGDTYGLKIITSSGAGAARPNFSVGEIY
ncbi:MAG: hypothetical protein KGL39_53750 [Patescibacteria group bacterium]|nr:hypothetical protein [Patescibacteria group bacterium]